MRERKFRGMAKKECSKQLKDKDRNGKDRQKESIR